MCISDGTTTSTRMEKRSQRRLGRATAYSAFWAVFVITILNIHDYRMRNVHTPEMMNDYESKILRDPLVRNIAATAPNLSIQGVTLKCLLQSECNI
mmetsp:Transcript_7368/g.13140  ORF Transcript_7368/g.13140 Transcript_7368/m.13140 type:complete len:96 (-) Transcript_7368:126-413(-)